MDIALQTLTFAVKPFAVLDGFAGCHGEGYACFAVPEETRGADATVGRVVDLVAAAVDAF